ncbi:MAG: Ig-like domain-containing protein [Bacilli bacterium]|nr:Ig-like domain-containing protein [Bacilli bacterium]
MKKRFKILMLLMLFVMISFSFLISNYNGDDVMVAVSGGITEITLERQIAKMNVGDAKKMGVRVKPSDTSDSLVWASSNNKVVTVDSQGIIRALGVGKAYIIAASKMDSSVRAVCLIEVVNKTGENVGSSTSQVVPLTGLTLSNTNMLVKTGQAGKLGVTFSPSNATNKAVSWRSSNPSVVSVDASGNVKALKAGTSVITVSSVDNPNVKATCSITVKDQIINVTSVKLGVHEKTMTYGESYNLGVSILPSNATNKGLTFKSSKPEIVSVSSSGQVKVIMNKNDKVTVVVRSSSNSKILDKVVITTRAKLKHLATRKISGELITVKGTGRGKNDPHVAQGFCVAHVGKDIYMFAAHRDSVEKRALVHVVKRTESGGKVTIKEINKFKKVNSELEHANGMTYIPGAKQIFVSGIKKNSSFKFFSLNDATSGNVNLGTSAFKNADGKNVYIGAVAYDETKARFYVGAGSTIRVADANKNIIKSTLKVDGKYEKNSNGSYSTVSEAQDVGAYNGKILVVRYNPKVSDSQSTVARPRNAIDVYDGDTLEYLGTNVIKLGSVGKWGAELESVDYYTNNTFVIYYGYPGSSKNYIGHIAKIKLELG